MNDRVTRTLELVSKDLPYKIVRCLPENTLGGGVQVGEPLPVIERAERVRDPRGDVGDLFAACVQLPLTSFALGNIGDDGNKTQDFFVGVEIGDHVGVYVPRDLASAVGTDSNSSRSPARTALNHWRDASNAVAPMTSDTVPTI